MQRKQLTEKLKRIAATVDSGQTPMRVRSLYVFGSYARGAEESGDLDVAIIHDLLPATIVRQLQQEIEATPSYDGNLLVRLGNRCNALMKKSLRRPGERIEIFLADNYDRLVGEGSKIPAEELVLIWREDDRDYESKIAAIPVDRCAGRAKRDHFVNIRRLASDIGSMEKVMAMLAADELRLARIPVENMENVNLSDEHVHWLKHWSSGRCLGRDSLKLLPLIMAWFEQQGEQCAAPHRCEIWSKSRTHLALIGRPSLDRMINVFVARPSLAKVCLLPHLKQRDSNFLFVFERGKAYRG